MKRAMHLCLIVLAGTGCAARNAEPPHVPTVAPPSAHAALDELDGRRSLPLLPQMANHQKQNMRDHLVAVNEIIRGLAADDFAAIEAAAKRIGFSPAMGQQCTHMGMGAEGFTDQAIDFHQTADGIAAAAQKRDRQAVLSTLDDTLVKCTTCHATYRQQIVDDARWMQLTGSAAPMHGAPHEPHR